MSEMAHVASETEESDLAVRALGAEWNHAARLQLAFLALSYEGYPRALQRIREQIRRIDRACGNDSAAQGSYHETLTTAWSRLVEAARDAEGAPDDFAGLMAANPELLDPRTISDYYSVARLALPRARAEFVLPDLKPLPKLRSACPRGGSPTARKEVVR